MVLCSNVSTITSKRALNGVDGYLARSYWHPPVAAEPFKRAGNFSSEFVEEPEMAVNESEPMMGFIKR